MKDTTPRRILILQGHPDTTAPHFCHALAQAYAEGASSAGHEVRTVTVASVDFPLLRSKQAWDSGPLPPALAPAQEAIAWSQHIVLVFPLWLGGMPALVYRWYFRAHSIKALERNILGFVGIAPIHETLIGMVEGMDAKTRSAWLDKLRVLGRRAG